MFAQAFEAASSGSPTVVLVSGEAGIGKSTLVAEAARRAGAPAFLGRGAHVGGNPIALAPLVDLVRQIRRHRPAEDVNLPALDELADALHHGGQQHRNPDRAVRPLTHASDGPGIDPFRRSCEPGSPRSA